MKHLRLTACIFVTLFLFGCLGMAPMTDVPPEMRKLLSYDEAITTLVAAKTSFNTAVNMEPHPKVKKRMLDIAYPIFQEADAALVIWKTHMDAGENTVEKMRAYQLIFNRLQMTLIQMGIVEVTYD